MLLSLHLSTHSRLLISVLAGLILLGGCTSTDSTLEDLTLTEEKLYQKSQQHIQAQRYDLALETLQLMEARFPFGQYADESQLDIIYVHYMLFDEAASRAAAERFIRLHPQHANVDYAYYLKGLSLFTEGSGLFERFMPTDLTQRDPGAARQSFADFAQLVNRFPDSIYAADARKRMVYLRNLLARYEIHVANYYFLRGAYLAAANRGRFVIENFQRTPAVPDALAVMVQAYKLLGMNEAANDSLLTLRSNYPDHDAFDENGEFTINMGGERSWLNVSTFGMVDPPKAPGFDTRKDLH